MTMKEVLVLVIDLIKPNEHMTLEKIVIDKEKVIITFKR